MRMIVIVILLMTSISLLGCSSMSGNVVPEKGPTMEQVYDSMEIEKNEPKASPVKRPKIIQTNYSEKTFHKIPNPELKIYVYPHLAGNDEVPIPGYYTEFNAYTRDHYQLSGID